jgi:hypothetical protein
LLCGLFQLPPPSPSSPAVHGPRELGNKGDGREASFSISSPFLLLLLLFLSFSFENKNKKREREREK